MQQPISQHLNEPSKEIGTSQKTSNAPNPFYLNLQSQKLLHKSLIVFNSLRQVFLGSTKNLPRGRNSRQTQIKHRNFAVTDYGQNVL